MARPMTTCQKCGSFLSKAGECLTCNPKTKAKPHTKPEYSKPPVRKPKN